MVRTKIFIATDFKVILYFLIKKPIPKKGKPVKIEFLVIKVGRVNNCSAGAYPFMNNDNAMKIGTKTK